MKHEPIKTDVNSFTFGLFFGAVPGLPSAGRHHFPAPRRRRH
jgi:hypothetical protein